MSCAAGVSGGAVPLTVFSSLTCAEIPHTPLRSGAANTVMLTALRAVADSSTLNTLIWPPSRHPPAHCDCFLHRRIPAGVRRLASDRYGDSCTRVRASPDLRLS